jgi:regulation of enolase protein 1 (concanavalin A-like superfamily)
MKTIIQKAYLLLLLHLFVQVALYSQNIGLFESTVDVGIVKIEGMASYNESNGLYTLTGAGANMWFDKDAFRYLYTPVSGDFDLRANMFFVSEGKNAHRKIGILFRVSLDENSPTIFTALHGDKLTALQYRAEQSGRMISLEEYVEMPDVFELERRGNKFIMRYGYGSLKQEIFREIELELSNEGYIGIYICSHEDDVSETALFTNVNLNKKVSTQ